MKQIFPLTENKEVIFFVICVQHVKFWTYYSFCVTLSRIVVMSSTKKTIALFFKFYGRHPRKQNSIKTSPSSGICLK